MKVLNKSLIFILCFIMLVVSLVACNGNSGGNNGGGESNKSTIAETDYYLIKDGKSDYAVVLSDNPVSWESQAGNEMVDNIFKATDVKLPLISESQVTNGQKIIVIGQTNLTTAANVSAPIATYGARGFVIKEKDGNVYIVGGDTQGTLYGVYEFLHHEFGYEPYAIDEIALDKGVTERKLLAFDMSEIPDIPFIQGVHEYYRFTNATAGHRMRFNTYNEIFIGSEQPWHNVFSYVPKTVYQKEHPKWYSNDGKELHYTAHGDPEELQLLQDTVFNKMVEKIEKDFASGKYYEYIGFMQNDHSNSFPSDDTLYDEKGNLIAQEGHVDSVVALQEKYGSRYPAAMLIQFINPLQERLSNYMKETHNGRKMSIMFFAYEQTEPAPVKEVNGEIVPIDDSVVVHPDATVFMALIRAQYTKDYEDSGADSIVKEWSAISSKQSFWLYNFYFNSTTFMYMDSIYSLQSYFQGVKDANATYLFFESPMTKNAYFPFNNLNVYLYSKLGWDVNCDVDELIDNYFENYYKQAAGTMREYFDSLVAYHAYLKKTTSLTGVVGVGAENLKTSIYNEGVLRGWIKLFDQAFKDIEVLKYTDKELYDELYSRILYDSLSPRYLLMRLYAKEAFTDETFLAELNQFKADCALLEVIKAGSMIPDVQQLDLKRN